MPANFVTQPIKYRGSRFGTAPGTFRWLGIRSLAGDCRIDSPYERFRALSSRIFLNRNGIINVRFLSCAEGIRDNIHCCATGNFRENLSSTKHYSYIFLFFTLHFLEQWNILRISVGSGEEMGELTKEQFRDVRAWLSGYGQTFSDEAIRSFARRVQYTPTEPGAPLSHEEHQQVIDYADRGCTKCLEASWSAIDAVLAKRNVRKEETVPIDGTLITRMMDANFAASHTPYSYPPNMVEGMTAVIADALLSPLTTDEKQRFGSNYVRNCIAYGDVDSLLKARRSLIEAKPKTPDERVCIVPNGSGRVVTLDGKNVYWFGNGTNCKGDAEIYRLGLIAKLKRENEAK